MEITRLVIAACLLAVASAGRLSTSLHPQYGESGETRGHVVATTVDFSNTSQKLLYLYSDIGVPAISLARTSAPHSLNISWNSEAELDSYEQPLDKILLARSYLQTSLFTRLMAINTSTYTPGQPIYFECNLISRTWDLGNNTEGMDKDHVSGARVNFTMRPDNRTTPCEFSISMSTSDTEGREVGLPHLKYSENSTRVQLYFRDFNLTDPSNGIDLATALGLNFVLEIIIVPDVETGNLHLYTGRSLDDEYTPSQFWHSQVENGPKDVNGFHYWKPIIYTDATNRVIKNSVHVDTFKNVTTNAETLVTLEQANMTDIPYSLATVLNGTYNKEDVRILYLVFNATTDSQQLFDMVVGIGEVPSDAISLGVILIIALGLGLPVIVLVFGVPSVTIYRRIAKRKAGGYAPIQ